jgi:predicted amidohydrolase
VGRHNPKRSSFGHSVIIDPWGTILAACPDSEGIAIAEIDPARQELTKNFGQRLELFKKNLLILAILPQYEFTK